MRMANEQSSSNFTSNGIVMAALDASGAFYFYHNPLLHGAHPEMSETQLHKTASQQNIEARLWQDPRAAVAKFGQQLRPRAITIYVRKTKDTNPDDSGKCKENISRDKLEGGEDKSHADVLGVMLPGGPGS